MLIFLGGLQGVARSLYEAASIDGAGAWRRFFHVTLPQISPVFFFNLVMGVIGALRVFDLAYAFGAAQGKDPGGPGAVDALLRAEPLPEGLQLLPHGAGERHGLDPVRRDRRPYLAQLPLRQQVGAP